MGLLLSSASAGFYRVMGRERRVTGPAPDERWIEHDELR
jgi:hypothetical protein